MPRYYSSGANDCGPVAWNLNLCTKSHGFVSSSSGWSHWYVFMFTILRPFGTRESIRQKADHGGQIVHWYWQHATNLTRQPCEESQMHKLFFIETKRVLLLEFSIIPHTPLYIIHTPLLGGQHPQQPGMFCLLPVVVYSCWIVD
jgi:hypothetical protein